MLISASRPSFERSGRARSGQVSFAASMGPWQGSSRVLKATRKRTVVRDTHFNWPTPRP